MFKVRLINRVLSHGRTEYPICGKSLKNYGQAVLRPEFGGFVFEMSLEDYERDKFDLIGQVLFQQQWVPEFYEAEESDVAISDPELVQINTPPPERTIKQRARDAGVWKKGMSEDEMKEALGFPV
jgi:hypothetical protein